jgi:hypothetical protein
VASGKRLERQEKKMRKVYVLGVLLFATSALQAADFLFVATSSTICGVDPCSASALFTVLTTNSFSVTLNNTLSSITDAGQLVTDLEFTLPASTVTLSSSSGTFVNISGAGVPTVGSTGATGWGFGSNNDAVANNWLLCIICGNGVSTPGGAQPSQGIIDTQASYSSANASIAGNGPHNPFLKSGAIFTFQTSGATLDPATAVDPFSAVSISFGTTFGANVAGVPDGGGGGTAVTPEPVSLMLAGGGLIGLAMLKRRRRQ